MSGIVVNKQRVDSTFNEKMLKELDRGIDDMENGRELSLEKAFQKINKLRTTRRDAGV